MPSMRLVDPRAVLRPARFLIPVLLVAASSAALAQSTPAVSTVVAFNASTATGNLILGPDGALYGTTASSSNVTGGLIYRATTDGSSVSTLYQLSNSEAYTPKAGLLLGSDGLLYGSTRLGAVSVEANTTGTVFSIKTNGSAFTILHRFAQATANNQDGNPINTDGAYPETALIEGSDGYLYGTTRAGGANGTGTIFRMARDGSGFQTLHVFGPVTSDVSSGVTANIGGAAPIGSLLQYSDGYLYGTASAGGVNANGTIYRLRLDGSGFEVVHEFSAYTKVNSIDTNADGAAPVTAVIDGGDGRLYGVASAGGANGYGTVYVLDPASRLLTTLHDFTKNDGNSPSGALILGSDSKLYGTTAFGGQSADGKDLNYGTMFSINRDGTGFAVLHAFTSADGSYPIGRLLQLNASTFVGITTDNGKCGYGTLFNYSTTGAIVTGNTRCGQKKNAYGGGGSMTPAVVLWLGLLGFARLRRRA